MHQPTTKNHTNEKALSSNFCNTNTNKKQLETKLPLTFFTLTNKNLKLLIKFQIILL